MNIPPEVLERFKQNGYLMTANRQGLPVLYTVGLANLGMLDLIHVGANSISETIMQETIELMRGKQVGTIQGVNTWVSPTVAVNGQPLKCRVVSVPAFVVEPLTPLSYVQGLNNAPPQFFLALEIGDGNNLLPSEKKQW